MTPADRLYGALLALRVARKIAVAVIVVTVVLVGFALIILPGPAVVVVPLGLGILATEFVWARRLLRQFQGRVAQLLERQEPQR